MASQKGLASGEISKVNFKVQGRSITDRFPGMSLPKCDCGRVEVSFVQSAGTCRWEVKPQKQKHERQVGKHQGSALTLSVGSPGGNHPVKILSSGPGGHQ